MPEDLIKFYVAGAVTAELSHNGGADPVITLLFAASSQPARAVLTKEDFDERVDVNDPLQVKKATKARLDEKYEIVEDAETPPGYLASWILKEHELD